jgi:hypothetical protein
MLKTISLKEISGLLEIKLRRNAADNQKNAAKKKEK